MSAWPVSLTAGSAILSLSVKSAIVFTFGLRVTSTNGIDCMAISARTSCGVPAVLSQIVASVVRARPDEVGLAGEQSVELGGRSHALRPRGFDVAETRGLGVLLDQLLRLDDDHREVGQAELLRHIHHADFGLSGAAKRDGA